jgi:outer membrane protein insertion porin family
MNQSIYDPRQSPFLNPGPDARELPLNVRVSETQTGRFMLGVGVNSDAGLVGSVILDEQNFDWTRWPRSWRDIYDATAFRGAGQRLRIEAVPGTQVQRYMASFQEPYFLNSDISFGLSGFFYDRLYREWKEQRLGGRISLGYHFTKRLSGSMAVRAERVNVRDPIDPTLPVFQEALGNSALYGFSGTLAHDTRDSPFLATEGHLVEMTFEQVIGRFQYPRGELDLRQYFLLWQRPDTSGRHVLSVTGKMAVSGGNTPIYDHYYAGGFSTIRGFDFRGASPIQFSPIAGDVPVGGHFMLLASAEYMFPITADDMLRAVVFCDTGTVQPSIDNWQDKYRVAPGFGFRITIPAMGPAPIAFDFAFPVVANRGDREQVFSFFLGVLR